MAVAYQSGFGSEFATEALEGALPVGRNSPQRAPYGLYAEQLSGTAFTAPRHANRRSWLYRIRPAVLHGRFEPFAQPALATAPFAAVDTSPNQLRWDPFPFPTAPADFIDGLVTIAGNGNASLQVGMGVHVYACNRPMRDRFFYDADGELLIVPQEGGLRIATELGVLDVAPGEIVVVPRGVRFTVALAGDRARGYVCENYGAILRLPELGPIGANGLANARDFLYPVAAHDEREGDFALINEGVRRASVSFDASSTRCAPKSKSRHSRSGISRTSRRRDRSSSMCISSASRPASSPTSGRSSSSSFATRRIRFASSSTRHSAAA